MLKAAALLRQYREPQFEEQVWQKCATMSKRHSTTDARWDKGMLCLDANLPASSMPALGSRADAQGNRLNGLK